VCAGWETNCAVKSEHGTLEYWPNSLSGADQPRDAFEQVSCGESWSSQTNCGVTEDGHIACWGARLHDLVRSYTGVSYQQVDLGETHACALDEQGRINCWGDGEGPGIDPTLD
jgi:alpha-tubulin suppressor-like RCC1 family protein